MTESGLEELLNKIMFQPLQDEFEAFSDEQKQSLHDFDQQHPEYLIGNGTGHSIIYLTNKLRKAEKREDDEFIKTFQVGIFARRVRWAYQLLMIYTFYDQNYTTGQLFDNNYIANDPNLIEKHGNMGYNLIQSLRRHYVHTKLSLEPIKLLAEVVASVKPEIMEHYVTPTEF